MVVVEPTGAEVQVFARLDGQDMTAVLRERLLLKPGESVKLAPDTKLVHVFDAERAAASSSGSGLCTYLAVGPLAAPRLLGSDLT